MFKRMNATRPGTHAFSMKLSPCYIAYILACLLTLTGGVRADPCYYLLMFGAQAEKDRPKYTHTFATFVKVDPTALPACQFEAHTISWLPATLNIRVLACHPECGRNVGLHETIRWALSNCEHVSMWGPYRIQADLYRRAVRQCALLDSGQVRYKAIDSFHKSNRVANCIHAVSSIDAGYRLVVLSPSWGDKASWNVLRRMEPCICDPCTVYPRIASGLGLDQFPIIRRPFGRPRGGP